MAAQTITDATRNHDDSAVSGLNNGENYTLNNSTLIINGDVRWGFNNAVIGRVTVSATLGGQFIIDGRDVWEVPFSASSGNVPTVAANGSNAISGSGVTGELFRVWATGSLTPSAAGGGMPATGWIKLRSKTGDFNGVVVTLPGGATVTCSGNGKRSWIHVVGGEGLDVTLPRLGKFTIEGDWYELGTTSGADDQTFQFPVADACPAIQIETEEDSGVYEWWLNAGDRWGTATQYVSTDARGKYFGMVNSTGVITIARRATNSCGFKPPSGCKVRIPNVICSSSTSANWANNTLNVTLATRYDFVTTSAGEVVVKKATMNWYLSCTSAFNVTAEDSSFLQGILISNIASKPTFARCAIGLTSTTVFVAATFSNLFSGIDLTDCRFTRYSLAASGAYTVTFADVVEPKLIRCQLEGFGNTTAVTRGNAATGPVSFARCFDILAEDFNMLGGRVFINSCSGARFKNIQYADQLMGNTTATNPVVGAITADVTATDIFIDGFANFAGLANVHPYAAIISTATGVKNIELRNVGTPDEPYNCGSANALGLIVTCSVTLGVTLRRIYTVNLRTRAATFANTVQNVLMENVWDLSYRTQITPALNAIARGCAWVNTVAGQTACYGRHWEDAFISETQGRLVIQCNEPLPATSDQCQEDFAAGSGWTSVGQLSMATVDDNTIWTMPYFALGITKIGNAIREALLMVTGTNHQNHSFDYQIDTGGGFGAWKRLATISRRSSGGSSGATTFVVNAADALPSIGDFVQSVTVNRFAEGATVTNVVGTTITVSPALTGTLGTNEVICFWKEIADEPSINPNTGFRLKVRATVRVANNTNALTVLRINTTTDADSRKIAYPLPRTQLTIQGFEPGTDVVVKDATIDPTGDGTNVIDTGDAVNSPWIFDYEGTPLVNISLYKSGYVPAFYRNIQLTNNDATLNVAQLPDRVYA